MIRKNRRNFLPTFIINFLLWIFLAIFLIKSSPSSTSVLTILNLKIQLPINIILFFIIFTLTLTLTIALLLGNTRRGFLLTLGVDTLLALQLIKQVNILNLVLVGAIIAVLELLFSVKKQALKEKV
ncbi:MAG: hypothetical protein ACOX50_01095 [Patescibacteria group bacterium]|jgi:hypothetical protein